MFLILLTLIVKKYSCVLQYIVSFRILSFISNKDTSRFSTHYEGTYMLPRVTYDGYEKLFIPDALSKWNSLNSNTEKLSKKYF